MPMEFGMWRIDNQVSRITPTKMKSEAKLEDIIESNTDVLGLDLMIIGRQVNTAFGARIDILAIDSEGTLHIIELKKDKTPRDVVAQILDYASWIRTLSYVNVSDIYESYANKLGVKPKFEEAFYDKFASNPPDTINTSSQLIIVASELDASTERIVSYLSNEYKVPVNAVFFTYFEDNQKQYLARTWLIDPHEIQSVAGIKPGSEAWNGQDYYVSLGEEGGHRNWDDCMKYGFVSGGQGRWYSKSLSQLKPDSRIFVNVPGTGYVGVGIVTEAVKPIRDFSITVDGNSVPLLELKDLKCKNMGDHSDDPEQCEYVVRVEWLKTLKREDAIWKKGMFANQNTACKLRNQFTLDTLVESFGVDK